MKLQNGLFLAMLAAARSNGAESTLRPGCPSAAGQLDYRARRQLVLERIDAIALTGQCRQGSARKRLVWIAFG